MTDLLRTAELEPATSATHAVIWLHGLGADGHDFEPIVPHLGLPADLAVRFVFPHAPAIPVTINGGMVMPAWYDILSPDLKNRADEAGVRASADAVQALITRENDRGIPTANIVLAGFSQGGAIATHLGLRHPDRLAGILALSTYLVCTDTIEAERSDANRGTPVFWGHGTHDPMVTIERGEEGHRRLIELGHPMTWRTYPMQHQVCPEETADIGAWLGERLTAAGSPNA